MKKRNLILFLIFTTLVTVVCRCSMINSPLTIAGHPCKFTGDQDIQAGTFDGSAECKNPDGSNLTCPYTGQPVRFSSFRLFDEKTVMSETQFWARLGCYPLDATATPTVTPPPTQTATSTETPLPAGVNQPVAAPLLTGNVTGCSLSDGYINFQLVKDAPPVNWSDVRVAMNGTQVNCSVPSNNSTVLSCALPSGVTFPVKVSVEVGGTVANEFNYDGAACLYTAPTNTPGNENPPAVVTPIFTP